MTIVLYPQDATIIKNALTAALETLVQAMQIVQAKPLAELVWRVHMFASKTGLEQFVPLMKIAKTKNFNATAAASVCPVVEAVLAQSIAIAMSQQNVQFIKPAFLAAMAKIAQQTKIALRMLLMPYTLK
jgi:hypothetical protein